MLDLRVDHGAERRLLQVQQLRHDVRLCVAANPPPLAKSEPRRPERHEDDVFVPLAFVAAVARAVRYSVRKVDEGADARRAERRNTQAMAPTAPSRGADAASVHGSLGPMPNRKRRSN